MSAREDSAQTPLASRPRKLDPRTNNLHGLDPAAYSTPARGQFGNLARNTQPGFGANNWDFSAIKNFAMPPLGEQSRLQLRFEWFNVFNHTQFFNPAATQNVPSTFGIVHGDVPIRGFFRSEPSCIGRQTWTPHVGTYPMGSDRCRLAVLGLAAQSTPAGKPPRLRSRTSSPFPSRVGGTGASQRTRYAVTHVYTDGGDHRYVVSWLSGEVLERWVKPTLVGEDLFAIDRHLKRLQMQRGESGVQTWSGVEHALWDAIGRACNQPVAKLLGGYRDSLRVSIARVSFPESRTSRMFLMNVRPSSRVRLKNAGYTAMKIRAWRPNPMDDVEACRVIKKAVGAGFRSDVRSDRGAARLGVGLCNGSEGRARTGTRRRATGWKSRSMDTTCKVPRVSPQKSISQSQAANSDRAFTSSSDI